MLSDQLLRQMIEAMPMPVFVKDGEDRYLFVNRAFETLFQVRGNHIIGQPTTSSEPGLNMLRPALPTCPSKLTESTTFCTSTGERLTMGMIHLEALGETSQDDRVEAVKTELREVRAELARVRETDPVTRCLSRRALRAHTEDTMGSGPAGVLRISVDDYDRVSSQHGQDIGDALLADFSDIVRANVRPSDVFARVGDSEFTVVLFGADREQTAAAARRICSAATDARSTQNGTQLAVSVTVGAAVSDDDSAALASLIDQAEDAMKSAAKCRNKAVMAPAGPTAEFLPLDHRSAV